MIFPNYYSVFQTPEEEFIIFILFLALIKFDYCILQKHNEFS